MNKKIIISIIAIISGSIELLKNRSGIIVTFLNFSEMTHDIGWKMQILNIVFSLLIPTALIIGGIGLLKNLRWSLYILRPSFLTRFIFTFLAIFSFWYGYFTLPAHPTTISENNHVVSIVSDQYLLYLMALLDGLSLYLIHQYAKLRERTTRISNPTT